MNEEMNRNEVAASAEAENKGGVQVVDADILTPSGTAAVPSVTASAAGASGAADASVAPEADVSGETLVDENRRLSRENAHLRKQLAELTESSKKLIASHKEAVERVRRVSQLFERQMAANLTLTEEIGIVRAEQAKAAAEAASNAAKNEAASTGAAGGDGSAAANAANG